MEPSRQCGRMRGRTPSRRGGIDVRQDDRAPFDRALHRARVAAYAPGEFVGQESFMTAGEIRTLALQRRHRPRGRRCWTCAAASPGPGACSPGSWAASYLGVDASASAVAIAREQRGRPALPLRGREIPPLPAGPFDVVLLLETMLAFEDKDALIGEIAAALRPGGRFAFTFEEGQPLTGEEREAMPDADTVWLTPLDEMAASLERAGLVVTWREDHSLAHRAAGAGADGGVRRGRRGHRRADRPPGPGRAARRPPAVDRVARQRAGAQARARGRAGLTTQDYARAMPARADDPPPQDAGRLPTGRIARTARVGGLVTGQGLRWAGMATANRVRSPEAGGCGPRRADRGARRRAGRPAEPDARRGDEGRAAASR